MLQVVSIACVVAATTLAVSAGAAYAAADAELEAFLAAIPGEDAEAAGKAILDAPMFGAAAVPGLAKLLTSDDASVVGRARQALERIVAHAAREGAEDERASVSDALVAMLNTDLPTLARMPLIRQLALVGGDGAVDALLPFLSHPDLGEPARQAINRIPGPRATQALLSALPEAPERWQCALIAALASRRDAEAVPALIELTRHRSQAVRLAAVDALGRIGDARGAAAISAALHGTGEQLGVAVDASLRLADAELGRGNRDAARGGYERALAAATSTPQRTAALIGIERISDPRSLPTVLRTLGDPDPVCHHLAMSLIDAFAGERAVAVMRQALPGADPHSKAALLRGLAARERRDPTPMLLDALKDPSDVVKIAAASALGEYGGIHNAPALLELAEHASTTVRPTALNSYLRLLNAELRDERPLWLIPLYNRALQLATREEECRLALVGVAEFADPSSLPLVEALTRRGVAREEALGAYVAIGKTLAAQEMRNEAIEVFRDAVWRGATRGLANECAAELRKLGVEADFAREAGFVTHWWLIGPFPSRDRAAFGRTLPPEREVDLDGQVTADGRTLGWEPFRSADIQGVVDLAPLFDPREDVAVCAYAEVSVERAADVILKIGSDDGVVCWLNGERVHANNASRPVRVDEDAAEAKLKAGTNTILLKILQGAGGWGFCLRITDTDGRPLEFRQREVPANATGG